MSTLLIRIEKLISEINNFNLGNCGPSDDPDMQTAYIFGYKDLIKRFFASAKRIENSQLQNMIASIDPDVETLYDTYNLRAEVQGILDFLEDYEANSILKEKNKISPQSAHSLSELIIQSLRTESATFLPTICRSYGLSEGTKEEAFLSKANYIKSRIIKYSDEAIFELAKKLKGKYPKSDLDSVLQHIEDYDDLNIISKFEKIKENIKNEIDAAKFVIWIAVAWFTDRDLANALYLKSKSGVNVQIILNDDQINFNMSQKLSEIFEVYKVPATDKFSKLMHHKFCMIDFKKVIHGSYNWTYKANYNNETISVVENRESAENFALEFIKLKKELIQCKKCN